MQIRSVLLAAAFARVYTIFVFAWAILYVIFGDRWAWLFLVTSFAPYLFVPLPVIALIAIVTRRREIWIEVIVLGMFAIYLYGGLFVPKFTRVNPDTPVITVMTYNMLGFSDRSDAVLTTIRREHTDLVAIQELNPRTAEAIQQDLKSDYPFQVLNPQEGTSGMGVISRYPLYTTSETIAAEWSGNPQILTLKWHETMVVLFHFHMLAPNPLPGKTEGTIHEREKQARAIASFAAAHPAPFIALGDFNSSDQSTAYTIITDGLVDSWREVGWGLGPTYPGINVDTLPMALQDGMIKAGWGSYQFPNINTGLAVPIWLIRLDYIFHSRDWRALSARLGAWDGYSDHRPVISELTLAEFLVK